MVSNPSSVVSGKPADLSWSAVGPEKCTVFDADDKKIGEGGKEGKVSTGALAKTSDFKITCTGGAGSANDQLTVTVK